MSDAAAHLARARQAMRNAAAVVPHLDADGLASGAIALRARGESAAHAVLLHDGRTPWDADAPLPDGPLAVLDWGMRPLARPALIVDHHIPEAPPRDDQIFVTGYGGSPATPTAVLMRRVVPEAPAWLAAVGAFCELGEATFALPEAAERRQAAVGQLATLVNAAHRVPDGPLRTALALLVEHADPREALADPRAVELRAAKRLAKTELARANRTEPVIGDRAALVRFSSACRIDPMVATTWARRLGPRVVVAANDGCRPGRVCFTVRGGAGSLPALLRGLIGGEDGLEQGQEHAIGGSLPPASFERLLDGLGLADAQVAVSAA